MAPLRISITPFSIIILTIFLLTTASAVEGGMMNSSDASTNDSSKPDGDGGSSGDGLDGSGVGDSSPSANSGSGDETTGDSGQSSSVGTTTSSSGSESDDNVTSTPQPNQSTISSISMSFPIGPLGFSLLSTLSDLWNTVRKWWCEIHQKKSNDNKPILPPRVDKNTTLLCFWVDAAPEGTYKKYTEFYNGSFANVTVPPKVGGCWHLNTSYTAILRNETGEHRTILPMPLSGSYIYECRKLYPEYPVCERNYSDIYIPRYGMADGADSLKTDIVTNGPFSVGWSALTGNLRTVPADDYYLKYFADVMWVGNFTFFGWNRTNWSLAITDAGQNLTDKQLLVQETEASALINLTAAARWRNVTGLNFYL